MFEKQTNRKIKKSFSLFLASLFINLSSNQISFSAGTNDLQSGPMIGYSEMKEVLLWAQTNKPAKVKFVYWDQINPNKKFNTKEIKTLERDSYTAKLIANQVYPGKKYNYELYIDGQKVDRPYPLEFQTPQLWQWRTDPPDFKVAMGSCTYVNEPEFDRPGKPYGGNYEIFTSIYNKHPDLMIWLGDNVYLREADWYSKTGIFHRYTHTRSLAEMQPLLASTINYAIIDDHDFGPNDSDRGFREKEDSLKAFDLFWGNPTYGSPEVFGAFTKFEWGDVEFFLLDDRTYRAPDKSKTGQRAILGDKQFQWLMDSLVSSQATFKLIVIGGQVLNPVTETFIEDFSLYPEEKAKLLDSIEKENIKGVIFISGDRHQSEVSVLNRKNNYPLYDFTFSPLTASPYDSSKEANTLRLPNTLYAERNFAVMSATGNKKERQLTFTLYDKDGKERWNKVLKASELK